MCPSDLACGSVSCHEPPAGGLSVSWVTGGRCTPGGRDVEGFHSLPLRFRSAGLGCEDRHMIEIPVPVETLVALIDSGSSTSVNVALEKAIKRNTGCQIVSCD
jgi:hypothetical protein